MRKRFLLALAACAALACASPKPAPPRGEPVLTVDGKVDHAPFRFGAEDLARLPRRGYRAQLPRTGEVATFDGVSLAQLLTDSVALSKGADTALLHGRGGVVAAVPLAAVRQLRPVLADRVNGGTTAAWRAEAAPLQAAWPNLEQPGIDTDPRMRSWWVEGVTRVEVVAWTPTYGRALRAPPGASDDARLGSDQVVASCIACHKVRSAGGTAGPALDAKALGPDDAAFAARLREHVRKATGSAAAPETSPAQARQIAAFLRAVSVAGEPRPGDEPVVPVEAPDLPPRDRHGR